MRKSIAKTLALALLCASVMPVSAATYGTPPTPSTGPGLVDGTWLNALAGGANLQVINGITAAGTNQATATVLPNGYWLYEVDTSGSGGATGVALVPCLTGDILVLNNNTAYTIDVYPAIINNPVTAAQDVIDVGSQATSTTITTYASKLFACAKNGVWTVK